MTFVPTIFLVTLSSPENPVKVSALIVQFLNSVPFEETFKDEAKSVPATIPTNPDGSPDVEQILDNTRRKIRNELWHYDYSKSGAGKLEDLVMETGGKPLRTVVVTTWRSGSTFLGEVLNAMPGNFYHYEPLRNYEIVSIRGPPHAERATEMLRSMLKCEYDDEESLKDYFEYKKTHMQQFRHNTRMWEYCKYQKELCFDKNFTARFCKLFPFQSMKLVRFRLHLVEKLLEDKKLNIKVVLLVRDPRGVLQSRHHHTFCPPAPDCWDPKLVCEDMVSDYNAAAMMLEKYPGRITVIRYEDLALDPKNQSYQLYDFLGLVETSSLDRFLETHTKADPGCMSSTYRDSNENAFKWKGLLDFDYAKSIQDSCTEAMRLWGYRKAENAGHMQSKEFKPIYKYSVGKAT
ncbi:sulfotransferase domain-containing protein [Phthorimaea operculella]|nr:sulfotransferase domain-containing protein [Phthorimaea operculella]